METKWYGIKGMIEAKENNLEIKQPPYGEKVIICSRYFSLVDPQERSHWFYFLYYARYCCCKGWIFDAKRDSPDPEITVAWTYNLETPFKPNAKVYCNRQFEPEEHYEGCWHEDK
jgi:hypothetical protein